MKKKNPIQLQNRLRYNFSPQGSGLDHFTWGDDDQLPFDAEAFFNSVAFTRIAADMRVKYICGHGFRSEQTALLNMNVGLPIGQPGYQSFAQLFKSAAQQSVMWDGSFCLIVRRNERGIPYEVDVFQDISCLRYYYDENGQKVYKYYYQAKSRISGGTTSGAYILLPEYQGPEADPDFSKNEIERQKKVFAGGYLGEILWFKTERYGTKYYPIPNWFNSSEIIQFNESTAKALLVKATGMFLPNVVISMPLMDTTRGPQGEPSQKERMDSYLRSSLTGETPRLMWIFEGATKETTPQVTALDTAELPAHMVSAYNDSGRIIFQLLGVDPALAGFATEGQLGQNQQLHTAESMLRNSCKAEREQILERLVPVINAIYPNMALDYEVDEVADYQYIDPIYLEVLSTDEKREIIGYEPLPQVQSDTSKALLDVLGNLSPIVQNKLVGALSVNEFRAFLGFGPVAEENADVPLSLTTSQPEDTTAQ